MAYSGGGSERHVIGETGSLVRVGIVVRPSGGIIGNRDPAHDVCVFNLRKLGHFREKGCSDTAPSLHRIGEEVVMRQADSAPRRARESAHIRQTDEFTIRGFREEGSNAVLSINGSSLGIADDLGVGRKSIEASVPGIQNGPCRLIGDGREADGKASFKIHVLTL